MGSPKNRHPRIGQGAKMALQKSIAMVDYFRNNTYQYTQVVTRTIELAEGVEN